MKKHVLLGIVALAALWPSASFAGGATTSGAISGAVVGGVVGGPVGAVVGGTVGAGVGATLEPPPPAVRTYVRTEHVPSVTVHEHIAVGQPLPGSVKIYTVPKHTKYSYAVVNNQRVIVEPHSRRVVEIID